MSFKGILLLVVGAFFIACKNPTQRTKSIEPNSPEREVLTSSDNLLVQFVKASSFDLMGVNEDEVSVLEDTYENSVLLLKVFVDEDGKGTGTLGWVKVDFQLRKVFDTTLDIENPKELTFDGELYRKLEERYGYKMTDNKIKGISCRDIQVENVFEEPLIEQCECATSDLIECYALFYDQRSSEYKDYLLDAISMGSPVETFPGSTHLETVYRSFKDSLVVNVLFEGGEDKFVFYKSNENTIINSYSFPD